MERLTNIHGECLKCVVCVKQSNCETQCSAVDNCIEKLKIYEDLEEQCLLIRLPCREGTKVYLARKCLAPSCDKCKDKNGKKIFEGDIISFLNCKAVVKWDDINARFLGLTLEDERKIVYVGREPKVKVIGNIFNYSELPKGGDDT